MNRRPIKFRAWNPNNNTFLYSDKFDLETQLFRLLEFFQKCYKFGDYNVFLQQSTGLYDSSNKEVYEGDILMDKNQLITGIWYKVIFDKGWFMAEYTDKEGKKFRKDIAETEFLIMGNEFENPELMELKK